MKDPIREQVVTARRKQILEAAAKVFAEKGFHATTIRDVAREAAIADGTIYNYFESKTALLLSLFALMQDSVRPDQLFAGIAPGDVRGFVRVFLRHPLMSLRADNFELFRVVMSEILVNAELRTLYYQQAIAPTIAVAEQQFAAWAAQGLIRPVNIGLTLRAVTGMVFGLILQYIMGDETLQTDWENLPDHLTTLILDGITE